MGTVDSCAGKLKGIVRNFLAQIGRKQLPDETRLLCIVQPVQYEHQVLSDTLTKFWAALEFISQCKSLSIRN